MAVSVVSKPMPGRGWYVLAALILVAGIAGGIYLGVSQIGGMADAFQRVPVPGESELTLDEAGTYTIFHETTGTYEGVVYSGSDITGLRVRISSAEGGEPVELKRPATNSSYDLGGSSAVGIFTFDIETPGQYLLSADYEDGREEPRAILSVASGFVSKLVATILTIVGMVLGSIALAFVIALVTFLRRRKAMAPASPPASG